MQKILSILMILLCLTGCEAAPIEKFYLESEYYEASEIKEITKEELLELENQSESFLVFVYQPMCASSSKFEKIVNEFLETNTITIYKISFENAADTKIRDKIRYYPSFVIYQNGEVVDALDANSDEDINRYETVEGLTEWLSTYIYLEQ